MSSRLLLDTNILIWTIFNTKLPDKSLLLITEAQEVYVSPLSILEIRIKQELGKLPHFDITRNIEIMDMVALPYNLLQAEFYSLHSISNKDPFDNALISVALSENLTFMTADKKILELKIRGLKTIDART